MKSIAVKVISFFVLSCTISITMGVLAYASSPGNWLKVGASIAFTLIPLAIGYTVALHFYIISPTKAIVKYLQLITKKLNYLNTGLSYEVANDTETVSQTLFAKVTHKLQQANSTMHTLRQEERQNSDLVANIQHTLEQTSILALNATIEAARLGESGRSFGAIAEEIRTMLQNVNERLLSINSNLLKLETHETNNIEAINFILNNVQEINKLNISTLNKNNWLREELNHLIHALPANLHSLMPYEQENSE